MIPGGEGVLMDGTFSEAEYKKFFERYRKFTEGLCEQRLEEFKKRFNQLKEFMGCIQTLCHQYEKETASQFNIFRVLGVERKEAKTHSAFIAHLLDPQGSHGQRYLFLMEFYKILKLKMDHDNEIFPDKSEIEGGNWHIVKEKSIHNGRLDIAVMDLKNKYALIIENKIDAELQEGQLEKYSEWIKRNYADKWILLYLTIKGESYISKDKTNPYPENIPLSYAEDIKTWLENSLRLISAPRLRENLEQYLNIIRFL